MNRTRPTEAKRRRHAISAASLLAAFGVALAGCPPKAHLLDAGVAGTVVANSNSRAVVLGIVYLLDDTGTLVKNSTTRTNQGGRFRIGIAPGSYHLVATDNAGSAGFQDITLAPGELADLGQLALAPCTPGASPNTAVYASCPAHVPVAAPPVSFTLSAFAADRVEATLYPALSPNSGMASTHELFLTADDDAHHVEISVWIPSNSPYFQTGTYSAATTPTNPAPASPADVSITLAWTDPSTGAKSYYVLVQGSLQVERLDPNVGGRVRLSISNALFAWGEEGPTLDPDFTVRVVATDPPIEGTITGSSNGENGSAQPGGPQPSGTPAATPAPPPGSVSFGTLPLAVVHVVPDNAGGINVLSYHTNGGSEFVSLYLSIPAAMNTVGLHPISNSVTGPSASWVVDGYGEATYSVDNGVTSTKYVLSSGSLAIQQTAQSAGGTVSLNLTGATFYLYDRSTSTGSSSATLTFSDSGTLSGTL